MGKGSLSSNLQGRFQRAGRGVGRHGTSDRLPFLSLASSDPMDRRGTHTAMCKPSPRICRPCDRTARAHLTQTAVRLYTKYYQGPFLPPAAVLDRSDDLPPYRSNSDIDCHISKCVILPVLPRPQVLQSRRLARPPPPPPCYHDISTDTFLPNIAKTACLEHDVQLLLKARSCKSAEVVLRRTALPQR